jgi:hypothetical protein
MLIRSLNLTTATVNIHAPLTRDFRSEDGRRELCPTVCDTRQGKELGPPVQRKQDAGVQRALLPFGGGKTVAVGPSYKHRI